MRWFLLFILLFVASIIGGYYRLKDYPYEQYQKWVTGEGKNKYYHIPNFKKELLKPLKHEQLPPHKEDFAQLWREFSIQNTKIPLPVRHPMYQTIPIVESKGKNSVPEVGMIFLDPLGKEIARIYTLPVEFLQDYSREQELFKLPYVRNRILKFPLEKIWKDFFSFEIKPQPKTIDEMIYDLYLLHLRSKMLPEETISYGPLGEDRSLISFLSKDKKYRLELIITYKSGGLYSFVLKTQKNSDEAKKLRSKFMESISFTPVDVSLGQIIYKEFKELNFARQIDQEGMLYLFSAWTQDHQNVDFFKEMIFYLERSTKNERQLAPLYKFAFNHFGKTFSTSHHIGKNEDPNIVLQRKIELEEQGKFDQKTKPPEAPEKELSPEDKMNLYLKKAKEEKSHNPDEAVVH